MKQNKVNHCKQYGLQWNDFKVPYGAVYGRYQGVNFVCTKLPEFNAQGVFVWIQSVSGNWYETTCYYKFESNYYACKFREQQAIINHEIFHLVLDYLISYYCQTGKRLKIEGYRPATCHLYTRDLLPKRRVVGKYTPSKECYAQRCVDGKGYAPAPYLFGSGQENEYAESMQESFPVYNESRYWVTFTA